MIFYADDDADDRELFSEVIALIDPNATVIFASDGLEAMELLKKMAKPPKLIFLDINMPIITGVECLKQIKATESLKKIPVVIFSTTSDRAELNELKHIGADEYIIKPNTFDALKDVIGEVVSKYTRPS
jgi:CheY-like chemotaxis protein